MIAPQRADWLALVAVGLVAVLVTLSGLGNGFAYDDVPLLVNDPRLHSFSVLPDRLTEPWWPGRLFRPVSLLILAVQWIAGAGSPVVFHLVSTILYAAVCGLVLLLCRRAGVGPVAALIGGLIFAVHPVHSEVTANVVGQAELLAAGFALGAVLWYLEARRRPRFRRRDGLAVAGLFLLAAHSKEGGYVVPGLLLAVELLVVRDSRPVRERMAMLREPALLLVAAFLAALALRHQVLGALGGETPHPTLVGLSAVERGVATLAVVPEWLRLFLWPVRLQAEYGPPGLVPEVSIGPAHLLGLVAVVVGGYLVARSWRRAPVVALGVVWMVVALAPVANVVFPTGLLLAERTLFLPSVGLSLLAAGGAERVMPGLPAQRGARYAAVGGLAVVLLLAGGRAAFRQPTWRDTLSILERTARDAPDSYRAQMLYGRELAGRGEPGPAEAALRQAVALWDRDSRPFEELGQLLRAEGRCAEAIPVLERGVVADSTSDIARSRLIECLIVERRWAEAEREIARGLAQGVEGYEAARRRVSEARETAP